MVTIKFYLWVDSIQIEVGDLITEQIKSRFLEEYPLSVIESNYDEDSEEYSLSIEVEDADQLLCEEICHEYEVYCEISDGSGETNNYYYDEDDEWIIK
jgi:hypothetical protein